MRVALWQLLALSAAASPLESNVLQARKGCNHDNCLRAIIANAFPTRHGAEDCAAYLRTTVTPAATTITQTVINSVFPTVTVDKTVSVDVPITVTEQEGVTVTIPATTIYVVPTINQPERRVATASPAAASNTIPKYASACSGAVRYSSACACVGASPTTITADAPVVTATVTETVTPVVATVFQTVATASVTKVVATDFVTSVVATKTGPAVSIPLATFAVQITSGDNAGKYFALRTSSGQFIGSGNVPNPNDLYYIGISGAANAATFFLDNTGSGRLYSVNDAGNVMVAGTAYDSLVVVYPPEQAGNVGGAVTVCSIDAGNVLSCHQGAAGGEQFDKFSGCDGGLINMTNDEVSAVGGACSGVAFALAAVPVPH